MISQICLPEKDEWQYNTVRKMQEELISDKIGYTVNGSEASRLVSVYGHPQVGKTTLILELLGVKKEYNSLVHKTLRAGRKKGDSSTSTAILYQKSDDNSWGISYKNSVNEIDSFVEKFDTQAAFQQELVKIRDRVESGEKDWSVIGISIPCDYVDTNKHDENMIRIVDLPGINGSSESESKQVYSMIEGFVAKSSVVIIVWMAYNIALLPDEYIPGVGTNWKYIPNRFFVVLTKSYSQSSIKRIISADGLTAANRAIFESISDSFGDKKAEIDFFPIDIGESIKSVPTEICDNVEREVDNQLNRVIDEIYKRRGDVLRSSVQSLQAFVIKQENDRMAEIDDLILRVSNEISKSTKNVDRIEKRITKFRKQIELNVDKPLYAELLGGAIDYCNEKENSVFEYKKYDDSIDEDKIEEESKKFDEDIKRQFEQFKKGISESLMKLVDSNSVFFDISIPDDKKTEAVDQICDELKERFDSMDDWFRIEEYTPDESLQTVDKYIEKKMKDEVTGFLFWWRSCSADQANTIISDFVFHARNRLIENTRSFLMDWKNSCMLEYEKLKKCDRVINKYLYREKSREMDKIENKKAEQDELERKRIVHHNNIKRIEAYINNYKRIAKTEYEEQMSRLLSVVNNDNAPINKRLEAMFIAGQMELDYNSIMTI